MSEEKTLEHFIKSPFERMIDSVTGEYPDIFTEHIIRRSAFCLPLLFFYYSLRLFKGGGKLIEKACEEEWPKKSLFIIPENLGGGTLVLSLLNREEARFAFYKDTAKQMYRDTYNYNSRTILFGFKVLMFNDEDADPNEGSPCRIEWEGAQDFALFQMYFQQDVLMFEAYCEINLMICQMIKSGEIAFARKPEEIKKPRPRIWSTEPKPEELGTSNS